MPAGLITACRAPNASSACCTMPLTDRQRGDALGVGDRLAARGADFLADQLAGPGRAFVAAGQAAAKVVDEDLRALLRRDQGAVAADAIAAAGDQNNLPVKNTQGLSPRLKI
ncbi:MAG: hypothetical protein WDM85_14445 [Caulobacteraceae bacterium]